MNFHIYKEIIKYIIFLNTYLYINHENIIHNTNFVSSTPLKKKNGYRQTDGIYCFANPAMKKFINVLHLTKYSFTIKVMI